MKVLEATVLLRIALAIEEMDIDQLAQLHNDLTSCKPLKGEDIESAINQPVHLVVRRKSLNV